MQLAVLENEILAQYNIKVSLSDESAPNITRKKIRITFGKENAVPHQTKARAIALLRSRLGLHKINVSPELLKSDADSYVISGKPLKNSNNERLAIASSPSSPSALSAPSSPSTPTRPSLNIQETGSNFSTPKKKKTSSPSLYYKPQHPQSFIPAVPSPLSTPQAILLQILRKEYLRLYQDLSDGFWHKIKDFFGLRDCIIIALKMQILNTMMTKLESNVSVSALVSEVFTVSDLKQQQNPILDLFVLRRKSRTFENLSTDIQKDDNLAQYIPPTCGIRAC
jgi:hypothetical protein